MREAPAVRVMHFIATMRALQAQFKLTDNELLGAVTGLYLASCDKDGIDPVETLRNTLASYVQPRN